jgi:hypothetical protein
MKSSERKCVCMSPINKKLELKENFFHRKKLLKVVILFFSSMRSVGVLVWPWSQVFPLRFWY